MSSQPEWMVRSSHMNVADWCRDLPDLEHFVTGAPRMLGEDWYAVGNHRYRARMPLVHRDPFGGVREAARRLGVRVEWDKNAGWMRLEGAGWVGTAAVGGRPELAMGEHLEILVQQRADPARAGAGARALALRAPAFAPFVQLCDEQGAAFESAVVLQFAGGRQFGYITFGRGGLGAYLAAHLDAWLRSRGFQEEVEGGETLWCLDGATRLSIARWDTSPDTLRVDIAGLAEFETRSAASAVIPQGVPAAADVFRRALSLWAVWKRMTFEVAWTRATAEQRSALERSNVSLIDWAEREGALAALSAEERRTLLQPVGGWNKPQQMNAGWCVEALGAIAWALSLVGELPPYGTLVSGEALGEVLGTLGSTERIRASARLRPRDALEHARADAEGWIARTAGAQGGGGKDLSRVRSSALERGRALRWMLEGGAWE